MHHQKYFLRRQHFEEISYQRPMTSNTPESTDPTILNRASQSVLHTLGMDEPEKKASLESAAEKTKDAATEAKDVIKDTAVSAKEAVVENAEKVKDKAGTMISEAKVRGNKMHEEFTNAEHNFGKKVVDPMLVPIHAGNENTLDENASSTKNDDGSLLKRPWFGIGTAEGDGRSTVEK